MTTVFHGLSSPDNMASGRRRNPGASAATQFKDRCIGCQILFFMSVVVIVVVGMFVLSDLHNYFKEMRYHVEITCDVINVIDLGIKSSTFCSGGTPAGGGGCTTSSHRCWYIMVLRSDEQIQFPAQLFKSVKEKRKSVCAKSSTSARCYSFKSNCLRQRSTLKCFYNPNCPEIAYMETGLSWFTYAFATACIIVVVFFTIWSLVICSRGERNPDRRIVMCGPCLCCVPLCKYLCCKRGDCCEGERKDKRVEAIEIRIVLERGGSGAVVKHKGWVHGEVSRVWIKRPEAMDSKGWI